jgi:RES domain-containing protein
MSDEITVRHDHLPLYRVLPAGRRDPLDASGSLRGSRRWNTSAFPALYTCCSENTARAVTRDRLNIAAADLEELQVQARPALFELEWTGEVVDVASEEGVRAAGFPKAYPVETAHADTQARATDWHGRGRQGVVCRSASLMRLGLSNWTADYPSWGEVAIFIGNAKSPMSLRRRRDDTTWFQQDATTQA